ncbi:MAG: hypothetical protein DMG83_13915 [Acidobacteria bacterium]|nr:MAG: hypothetical protein DMG83_13915 [Acidobacteriota bacterium]
MHFHHEPVTPDTCRDSHLSPKRSGLAAVPLLSQLVILIAAKDPSTPAADRARNPPPVAIWPSARDNRSMENAADAANPFRPGTMVVTTLANPREKFWGAILSLSAEGLSLRGIELASFEDLVALVKDGEPFSLGVVFFPMHRVERMELDLPDGNIPSLSQRFTAKTGLDPVTLLRASSTVDAAKERG